MIPTFLEPGETATFAKTITEADLVLFAGPHRGFRSDPCQRGLCSGNALRSPNRPWRPRDGPPVDHRLDDVAPLLRARLARHLRLSRLRPIRFLKPVFIGDTLTARYTIEEMDAAAARSRSSVEVTNQHGETCLAGTHIMKWVAPAA